MAGNDVGDSVKVSKLNCCAPPAKSLLMALFTLYLVDFCTVSNAAMVQCEQEVYSSLCLACFLAHILQNWCRDFKPRKHVENRLRWVAFGFNLDPVIVASNLPKRSPVVILAPTKAFRLGPDRFENLSDTIRSTFNSAAEQSCSGTKIVRELAFPVWTGTLFDTHLATFFFTVRYSVNTTFCLFRWSQGNSATPGSTLPWCTALCLSLFKWVFRCPRATTRGELRFVQHRVTRVVEITFLYVNRLTKNSFPRAGIAHYQCVV